MVNVIVSRPSALPNTMPFVSPIGAIKVLLLLQVPGPDASLSIRELPKQIFGLPEIGSGSGFTVTVVTAVQPVVVRLYVAWVVDGMVTDVKADTKATGSIVSTI